MVVAEFDWEADMDFALIDVQKKMGVYATDEDIETLDVVQEDPQALPVMRLAVSPTGDYDLDACSGAGATVVKPKCEAPHRGGRWWPGKLRTGRSQLFEPQEWRDWNPGRGGAGVVPGLGGCTEAGLSLPWPQTPSMSPG